MRVSLQESKFYGVVIKFAIMHLGNFPLTITQLFGAVIGLDVTLDSTSFHLLADLDCSLTGASDVAIWVQACIYVGSPERHAGAALREAAPNARHPSAIRLTQALNAR
jgi:hypothetical protein